MYNNAVIKNIIIGYMIILVLLLAVVFNKNIYRCTVHTKQCHITNVVQNNKFKI